MNFNNFAAEVHSVLSLEHTGNDTVFNCIHLCWSLTWAGYVLGEEPLEKNKYDDPRGFVVYMCDAIIYICAMMASRGLKIRAYRVPLSAFMDEKDLSLARFLKIMHGWTTTLDTLNPDWNYGTFTRQIIDHTFSFIERYGIDPERLLRARFEILKHSVESDNFVNSV